MSDKQKRGILYDAAQTVEVMRKLISWFRIEDCRTDMVRFGNEFAHPLGADALSMDTSAGIAARTNITAPETFPQLREEVQNGSKRAFDQANLDHPEWEEFGWWEEYDDIPGCPEEPDAPKLHALVRRLRENEAKGPFPTILVIPTGALFFNDIWLFSNATITKYLGAQTVIPKFRSLVDAPYPAAVNDLHATYQWMIDNAQALNIDTDRIVIYGMSSGGHLASALPFRLKRYGWCGGHMPRGVIAQVPFLDDRETTRPMRSIGKSWSGLFNRAANMCYMGNNFASGFIGPEAYANHATVEECRGLCPYIFQIQQDDCGSDHTLEFVSKLGQADVYCSLIMQGGTTHAGINRLSEVKVDVSETYPGGVAVLPEVHMPFMNINQGSEFVPMTGDDPPALIEQFVLGHIKDLLIHDLRRLNRK